ncbi:B12-binding domain-containing radical SAM protein [Acanthopleuribacter pedis]|uniref:B12-binding domain-containing radical SAM protein n=1 Tax=Acanthopleuribacter pedis TaxID=442870 RepID=A0A8J7U7M4_9BACT|nr:radical SAM protein [Acanthopleuribacter pedis]MBO1323159.1 B12-binding domain-containing radical SAM protein [Acanthopleuribacter pedis]
MEKILGWNSTKDLDLLLVNAPLKNYDITPRYNDFTLPVLGLGYIATYAASKGFQVGLLDVEGLGIGFSEAGRLMREANPRWVGFNLLAPTYQHSVALMQELDPETRILLGGHQAKAMPQRILADTAIPRIDALVIGEAETRVAALLEDGNARLRLPLVYWRDDQGHACQGFAKGSNPAWLSPDINGLPLVDRRFFAQDPTWVGGHWEANLVGSRGCPYDCSFCGAAVSANPDVSIRTRSPENILTEMNALNAQFGVTAFRFVDDLFLASPPFMKRCLAAFEAADVGGRYVWDATGRINIMARASADFLSALKASGCREVALGIESGSERVLKAIGKRITPQMILDAVVKCASIGIHVKGYFILGFPDETRAEFNQTVALIEQLWAATDGLPGRFRCSVFEFRPYPGTPEWRRLVAGRRFSLEALLDYRQVDLTEAGALATMLDRDEFNFSVNLPFGEVPPDELRRTLIRLTRAQKARLATGAA